jgi:ankyrin repeat protein
MRRWLFAVISVCVAAAGCGQTRAPQSAEGALGFVNRQSPAYKFHEAVYLQDARAIRQFAAADPSLLDAPNDAGMTPLGVVVTHRMLKPEVAQLLLELGADPNRPERSLGHAPLHFAAMRSPDWVRLLLDHSANPEVVDAHGHVPLYYALSLKRVEGARMLLERMRPTVFTAAASGDIKQLRTFLRTKEAVSQRDAAGMTPLHWAAMGGRQEAAKLLLEAGADAWARTNDGKLADVMAAILGYSDLARILHPPLRSGN